MKWNKFPELLMNSLKAVMRGEFLLRIRFDRYFPQIIFLFFLIWSLIWTNLEIEQTMLRMEKNKRTIEDLRIYHSQVTCELVSFDRLGTVSDLLEQKGSDVTLPEKPAYKIKK